MMGDRILGIHHITALAESARQNLMFYREIIGLRLVKKTVNFDDPGTWHFYFGDRKGTPGTLLTFFPIPGIRSGRAGVGMATEIGFSVPVGSLEFWKDRFKKFNIKQNKIEERFGERYLSFQDPDGLKIILTENEKADRNLSFTTEEINESVATRGIHSVTLTLRNLRQTIEILTDVLGYEFVGKEGSRYRYKTNAVESASIIDLVEDEIGLPGTGGSGTNHHIAFRVENEEVLMNYRKKIEELGIHITPKINRDYFFSLYFREPGGVLFEIATDNPGFAIDEPVENLGSELKLPQQFEGKRKEIEKILPVID